MKARQFDPPLEVDCGGGFVLHVKGAMTDKHGTGVIATVATWNGTLKHTDLVPLSSDVARRRYAKAVHAADAAADMQAVGAALLKLSHQLPDVLRGGDAAEDAAPEREAEDAERLLGLAHPLLDAPRLVDRIHEALMALGLVGERRTALLTYLAATSRLFDNPVSVIIKGASSGGKTYTLARVLVLLPESAYIDYTSVSPRYLAYSNDDLRHKIVVLYEAGGVSGETGAYVIRSLLSEGKLRIGTVDRGDGESIQARSIEKEGPTALFTTTTRTAIDGELETRALSLGITDTPDQSRAILARTAEAYTGAAGERPDLAPWHALQEWLAVAGSRQVRIPYAGRLAALTPCVSLRVRRDFSKVLTLIAASAVLHQRQRDRTDDNIIIASIDDYVIVRELVAEAFAASQQDGLTPAQRQAVEAVRVLCEERGAAESGVTLAAVTERLGLDRSATQRRLANPQKLGYLKNLEEKKGGHYQARYVPGEPLPAAVTALPTVEALAAEENEP